MELVYITVQNCLHKYFRINYYYKQLIDRVKLIAIIFDEE